VRSEAPWDVLCLSFRWIMYERTGFIQDAGLGQVQLFPSRSKKEPRPWQKEYAVLVLSRKRLESIRIGDEVILTVLAIRGNVVQLGIDAPCRYWSIAPR
jgi:hypothetical protein